jgi:hypothetical protein
MTLRVVRVAMCIDGQVHAVPRPCRHHHVVWLLYHCGFDKVDSRDQGFVLSDGRYVDRREARTVAEAAGQLLPDARKSELLFSEDVW